MSTQPQIHKILLCEDSVDGIFTGIYKAWEQNPKTTSVQVKGMESLSLFYQYEEIGTDTQLALKVARSIRQKLSPAIYSQVYQTALSNEPEKGALLLAFLQKAFAMGPSVIHMLQDDIVLKVFSTAQRIGKEAHMYLEFVRFEELENGVLISRVNPRGNVVPIIAPHFADRLHCENWVILDTERNIAAVHSAHHGYILTYDIDEPRLLSLSSLSQKENQMQQLWQKFFHSIAIESRKNPELQRSMMPLRYRKYMNLR